MHPQSTKDKAIKLRKQHRMTLPEILEKVPVSKATLSLWLREYPLTESELKVRRQVNARHARWVRGTADLEGRPTIAEVGSRPDLSKSDLGEACRQMICAKLLLRGVKVFRPLTEDTPIDLVVLTSTGNFLKCQCKCVFKPKGQHHHIINFFSVRKWGPNSKAVQHKYTPSEVDFFLGYCVDNDGVYVIPYSEVNCGKSVSIWVTAKPFGKKQPPASSNWLNSFESLK